MSDIQRYCVWNEDKLHLKPPSGTSDVIPVYVALYDDHVAECERRYELWQEKYKSETEKLQSAYNDACAEIRELKDNYSHIATLYEDTVNELTTYPVAKIKAEGIREMVAKTKKDYYNPVTETTTDLIEMSEALGYADKLERGDA